MTRLLSFILCTQLIFSPLSMAADTPPPIAGGDQYRNGKAPNATSVASYMNQVMALSTGLIGTSILEQCKLGKTKYSVITYFVGSMGYIAAEIWGATEMSKAHKRSGEDLQMKLDGETKDYQLDALNAALAEEKRIRDFVALRWKIIGAIGVVYTGAAVIAAYELIRSIQSKGADDGRAGCDGGYGKGSEGAKIFLKILSTAWIAGTGADAASDGTFGMIMGGIKGIIALVTMVTDKLSEYIAMSYDLPVPRMITFGVSAALMGVIAGDLAHTQSVVEGNITKISKVRDEVEKYNALGGVTPDGPPVRTEGEDDDPKKGKVKLLPKSKPPKCLSNSTGSMTHSETGCKTPVRVPRHKLDPKLKLDTLSAFNESSMNFTDAILSGDMAKAGVEADNLNAMSANLRNMKKELDKKINQSLKEKGLKEIDFDARVQDQLATLKEHVQNAAKSNNISLPDAAAPSAPATTQIKEEKVQEDKSTPTGSAVASAPAVSTPEPTPIDPELGISDGSEMPGMEEEKAKVTQALNEYDTVGEDVSKRSEISIFKQLSNRYILNYEKVLELNKK